MRLFFRILLIVMFYLSAAGWIWQEGAAKKDREANRLYSEGKLDEALSKWQDLQIENPDSKELHYNIANALYKQKKYEDAFNGYKKAMDTKDAELQSKTYYNMGNTHYRIGELPEAIEDYKKCLDINPSDEDAKYNIEFIRKKIKDDSRKEQKSEGEEKKDSEERKSRMEKEKDAGKSFEQKDLAKSPPEGEMPEEDAIRLLDALKDDEKDLQRELRREPLEYRYRVDKDW